MLVVIRRWQVRQSIQDNIIMLCKSTEDANGKPMLTKLAPTSAHKMMVLLQEKYLDTRDQPDEA